MDDMREEVERKGGSRLFVCHRDSPGIFPAQWSFKNGVKISPPAGITVKIFTYNCFLDVLVVEASGVFLRIIVPMSIYEGKNSGPRREPCGTPKLTFVCARMQLTFKE